MKSIVAFSVLLILMFITPLVAQNSISIDANGGVEYVVTDPLGRKEGIDPITQQRYRDINNSYGVYSVDSEDPDYDPPEPFNEFMTQEPVEGLYRLTLYGTRASRYKLFIVASSQERGKGFEMSGVIDSNQARTVEFSYSPDSSKPFVVHRLITAGNLREDISICYRLDLLGGRLFHRELLDRIENVEKRLARRDTSKAHEELLRMEKELKKIWERMEKADQKRGKRSIRFLTKEAYDILQDDVTVLLNTLASDKHQKRDHERKKGRDGEEGEGKKESKGEKNRN